jgi:hypothetical protein
LIAHVLSSSGALACTFQDELETFPFRGYAATLRRPNPKGRKDRAFRDAYTSALVEVGGVSPFVIDVLTNHHPPRGSVTAGYIDLSSTISLTAGNG